MPKTATPRKPETVSRKLAETRATSKNRSLSSLLGIGDNEKRLATDFGSGLNDVIGRGTIAGLLGLPGDLGGAAENGLRSLLGLPQVVPYGGSEHIGQKMEQAGLVSNVRRPKTELLASLISPAQAATAGYKAPQMARAGVKALDNLSAPRTMGRQQGAIENLWHGSPHTFDRFDLSKIGTGEGAQAYGHGAYLAESKGVGESYKASTSRPEIEVRGEVYKADDSGVFRGADGNTAGNLPDYLYSAMNGIIGSKPDISNAQLAEEVESFLQTRRGVRQSDIEKAKSAIINGEIVRRDTGNLYQTRLAWPDAREATDPLSPDHFLHWDKPLSEQPENVRNLLKEHGETATRATRNYKNWEDVTAGDAFKYFRARRGYQDATKDIADLGIPGIRYLDGGSRGAGAGSHNYVVFDDKLIDIVSRNGQPVK